MAERITITILRHGATGLLAAISDDLRGIMVAGRSIETFLEQLPASIEGLLKIERGADARVLGIEVDPREDSGWAEYEPCKAVATVESLAA